MQPVQSTLLACHLSSTTIIESVDPVYLLLFTKCNQSPNIVGIVLVVVVRIAIVEVDVPTIIHVVLS